MQSSVLFQGQGRCEVDCITLAKKVDQKGSDLLNSLDPIFDEKEDGDLDCKNYQGSGNGC